MQYNQENAAKSETFIKLPENRLEYRFILYEKSKRFVICYHIELSSYLTYVTM